MLRLSSMPTYIFTQKSSLLGRTLNCISRLFCIFTFLFEKIRLDLQTILDADSMCFTIDNGQSVIVLLAGKVRIADVVAGMMMI
ncbi:uncharacterized protein H6S33_003847 [Morchella sextelata]|uniref:uncharacterized protein n=1 Tax=Morchella sextelata TaxID=1174677 RepID=UPI001D055B76|nr:uncharacterized protein H6S33_003847 [Morchella sextelata]KAH0606186.1 hypothetical protein H6S33_003847 [Morchella sextelata]